MDEDLAIGLGSMELGIGATAVTLPVLARPARVAPKRDSVSAPFQASVSTGTGSVSIAEVVLITLISVRPLQFINIASTVAIPICPKRFTFPRRPPTRPATESASKRFP